MILTPLSAANNNTALKILPSLSWQRLIGRSFLTSLLFLMLLQTLLSSMTKIVYEEWAYSFTQASITRRQCISQTPTHMFTCIVNIKAMTAINNASWFHMTYAVYICGNQNGGVTSV